MCNDNFVEKEILDILENEILYNEDLEEILLEEDFRIMKSKTFEQEEEE